MLTLIVGDANADLCGALRSFPHEGDDAEIDGLAWASGGSATNTAAAIARLGAGARLVTRVGRDPAAAIALAGAREAGVDLGLVERDDQLATGLCFAAISPGGERTFFSSRGANVALELACADRALDAVDRVHVGGHALLEGSQRAACLRLLHAAWERALPTSIDLCLPLLRADPGLVAAIAPRLDVALANEAEAALFAVARGAGEGPRVLCEKLGRRGARVTARGSGPVDVPAFAVDAVDTTGSGDAFAAAFLVALGHGAGPDLAARVAAAAGALAATRVGAIAGQPTRAALARFLAERGAHEAAAVVDDAP
jgi:sugar/nucleoside kinase (ribokinase family)